MTVSARRALASVVIPAHNEARRLHDSLDHLLSGLPTDALDVVVVCHGCTDDTAAVARSVGVTVIEIPQTSQVRAVEVGNRATSIFPRVHLDAAATIDGPGIVRLADALREPGVLAAAPRTLLSADRSWSVQAYRRALHRLSRGRAGRFGRGVVALSAAGQARVDALPMPVGGLAMSEAFGRDERRIVDGAVATVRSSRTGDDRVGSRESRVAIRPPVPRAISSRARRGAHRAVRAAEYTTLAE